MLTWATAEVRARHEAQRLRPWHRAGVVRCPCGHMLARRCTDPRFAGWWELHHRGRRAIAPTFGLLQCEQCGTELRMATGS